MSWWYNKRYKREKPKQEIPVSASINTENMKKIVSINQEAKNNGLSYGKYMIKLEYDKRKN